MGLLKRIGLGIATGGLSELGGARPIAEGAVALAKNQGVQDYLVGGGATRGLDTKPAQYDAATTRLGQIATGAPNRAAPTAGRTLLGAPAQLATGQIDQSRGGLLGVANRLGGIASGAQLGAGELGVNRQVGQATAAQQAAARMARGANAALAYRNAARNTADIGLAGAGMASQAAAQDQANANAQLGQIYGNLYGQDSGVAAQNAQLAQQTALQQGALDQQTALANLQAQLAQTGMNDQQQLAALGQMLGWDQATLQAQLAKAQIAAGDKGILPGLLQVGGQIGAAYATGGASLGATGLGAKPQGGNQINSLGLMNPYG